MQDQVDQYKSDTYISLYYKNFNSIGIRQKKDDKDPKKNGPQLFSFGRGTHLSEIRLRNYGAQVLKRLDKGEEIEDVKRWVGTEMAKYKAWAGTAVSLLD